jgi:hypothetical protein
MLYSNQFTCSDGAILFETYLKFPGLETNWEPPEFKEWNASHLKATRKVFVGNVYEPQRACTRDVTLFSPHSLVINGVSLVYCSHTDQKILRDAANSSNVTLRAQCQSCQLLLSRPVSFQHYIQHF